MCFINNNFFITQNNPMIYEPTVYVRYYVECQNIFLAYQFISRCISALLGYAWFQIIIMNFVKSSHAAKVHSSRKVK